MDILDLVWPKRCVGCGKAGGYVCKECEVGMWEEEQICPACRRLSRYGLRHEYCKRKGYLEGLTCFWAYDGIARKLMSEVKYHFYYDYLREFSITNFQFFNRPEYSYILRYLETKPTLVPIPLHRDRLKWRGFNQAEMICQLTFGNWHLENKNLLIRVKETGQQVGRTREARLQSTENAFEIDKRFMNYDLRFMNILLVDDVWTTGATMQEAAKTLKEGGVKEVWGLVLAR